MSQRQRAYGKLKFDFMNSATKQEIKGFAVRLNAPKHIYSDSQKTAQDMALDLLNWMEGQPSLESTGNLLSEDNVSFLSSVLKECGSGNLATHIDNYERMINAENELCLVDAMTPTVSCVPTAGAAFANGEDSRFWPRSKKILKVYFLDGSPELCDKVLFKAAEWSLYADVTFSITSVVIESDIRITFQGQGCWSVVGTDAESTPKTKATMCLSALRGNPKDEQLFSRKVLHEFGHALGLLHEHQHPMAKIPWNLVELQAYYSRVGWNFQQVQNNVLKPTNANRCTVFDPDSIMMYPILASHVTDANFQKTETNHTLSEMDKVFIAQQYPKSKESMQCVTPMPAESTGPPTLSKSWTIPQHEISNNLPTPKGYGSYKGNSTSSEGNDTITCEKLPAIEARTMNSSIVPVAASRMKESTEVHDNVTMKINSDHVHVSEEASEISLSLSLNCSRPSTANPIPATTHVIMVIDQSSSMDGEPMKLLKLSMEFIIQCMQESMLLTVVVFSGNASRLINKMQMSPENKLIAVNKVNSIVANGYTDICSGLCTGIGSIQQKSDRPVSILLLSDGEANHGKYTQCSDILTAVVTFMRECFGRLYPIDCVGLGAASQAQLLVELALATNGNVITAKTSDDIPRIFTAFITNSREIFATQLSVEVVMTDGIQLHSINPKPIQMLHNKGSIIRFKPADGLNCDAPLDYLIRVHVPSGRDNLSFQAVVEYKDLAGKLFTKKSNELTMVRQAFAETLSDELIQFQTDKARIFNSLKEALMILSRPNSRENTESAVKLLIAANDDSLFSLPKGNENRSMLSRSLSKAIEVLYHGQNTEDKSASFYHLGASLASYKTAKTLDTAEDIDCFGSVPSPQQRSAETQRATHWGRGKITIQQQSSEHCTLLDSLHCSQASSVQSSEPSSPSSLNNIVEICFRKDRLTNNERDGEDHEEVDLTGSSIDALINVAEEVGNDSVGVVEDSKREQELDGLTLVTLLETTINDLNLPENQFRESGKKSTEQVVIDAGFFHQFLES